MYENPQTLMLNYYVGASQIVGELPELTQCDYVNTGIQQPLSRRAPKWNAKLAPPSQYFNPGLLTTLSGHLLPWCLFLETGWFPAGCASDSLHPFPYDATLV